MDTATGKTTTSQQSGSEPVSGEKGAGTATEPYDQGNAAGTITYYAVDGGMRVRMLIRLLCIGSEGGPPKQGMGGALEDIKKATSDAAARQSL